MKKEIAAYFDFNSWKSLLLLFLFCMASRLLTTIYYIEDPDSMRFAIAVQDFDLAAMHPHFPGYAVFCFLVKAFMLLVGKFSLSFSIVGGLATFAIIIVLLKLNQELNLRIYPALIAFLVFFNPMIWLMGNKYLSDLSGLAILLIACYYYWKSLKESKYSLHFMFFIGILAGTRLSYLPFLLLPFFDSLIKGDKKFAQLIMLGTGIAIWLIPMIIDTGLFELIQIATTHSEGHFYEWGGTISTEPSYWIRLSTFIRNIIADGMGGYWEGRGVLTIIISIAIITSTFIAIANMKGANMALDKKRKFILVSIVSVIIYALWAFLFQNIIYNPRHILPILPLIILLTAAGISILYKRKNNLISSALFIFLCVNIFVTLKLVHQHTQPTAIAQVSQYLKKSDEKTLIISLDLMNQYLIANGVKAGFQDIQKSYSLGDIPDISNYNRIVTVGDINYFKNIKADTILYFYHNPYVNRIWADIAVKEIRQGEKK